MPDKPPRLSGVAARCFGCGAYLKSIKPERIDGHKHASKSAFIGEVYFHRWVFTCPKCGLKNHRDRRVTWS